MCWPKPVLGGATVVMFAMVAIAGLRIVAKDGLTPRNEFILAITLALGLGVTMVPEAVGDLASMAGDRAWARTVLGSVEIVAKSGLAVAAITATTLNLVLPRED